MLPSQKIKSFSIQKAISKDFVFVFKKKPGDYRLTIVITKKIVPRAVDRNRIKRLIKEAFRTFDQFEGEIKIIVKNNMSRLKLDDISKILKCLVEKVK